MKIAVVGNGGREQAIIKALSGTHEVILDVNAPNVDLVIIGPEQPLVDGLSDQLRQRGIPTVGASQRAAQLESSKIYSKEFMTEFKIPTAHSVVVESFEDIRHHYKSFSSPWVLKLDGLAAGKGVTIHKTEEDLFARARELKTKALLEQYLPGQEMSYLILTNGKDFEPLPVSRDHKRLYNNDEGPNTGGMGTIAPISISEDLRQQIHSTIVEPTLKGIQKRNLLYRGVLYIGLMITKSGPQVIEYNARFGDPEAQVLLPLLDGDWAEVFWDLAHGKIKPLKWKKSHCTCVVLAAPGYPDKPEKGLQITGLPNNEFDKYVLHAATKFQDNHWLTNGGRVLNCIGLGSSLDDSLNKAYEVAKQIHWKGIQFRTDIGK